MNDSELLQSVPAWVLRPLPDDAEADESLLAEVRQCGEAIADRLARLRRLLAAVRFQRSFAPAVNLANALVWRGQQAVYDAANDAVLLELLAYADNFLPCQAEVRVLRRLANHPSPRLGRAVADHVRRLRIREVALPGQDGDPWDETSWRRERRGLSRHQQGLRIQRRYGVAQIADIETLRETLNIVSTRQLGWMLTSTDQGDGPYLCFDLAKRDGGDRRISAPKWQLRAVQRRILEQILSPVSAHPAAHGFVRGRSAVTNAAAHVGAALLVKFDLRNFFPTIHWTRVLGLFASFGYPASWRRRWTDDRSAGVALALTRLCTYTPDPKNWKQCVTPQGAPTSPAIANLVCRRMDARLDGLAKSLGGVYTRYADDLTFSFADRGLDAGRFRWWVDQICQQEGFYVHQGKFRVIRSTRRQMVTGIVVNQTMRVPREQRRRFRAILHNCRQHGLDSQRRGRSDFESYLRGYASYLYMVDPDEGQKRLDEVELLLREQGASS